MKKLSFKEIFIPTISLFIICLAVAFLLSATNELTKKPIEEQAEKTAQTAMHSVCPDAVSFESPDSSVEAEINRGLSADGELVGYAIPSSSKGYGGDIEIMVGFDLNGEVTGVEILSQGETPGLGANCTKSQFTDMYKQPVPEGGFAVSKDGGSIDAITGATITSRAVTKAVNEAVAVYNSIEGGES
ncbi:MAG: RnfABCDGE type electron transport complex subunit G [Ruminococcus sp.]